MKKKIIYFLIFVLFNITHAIYAANTWTQVDGIYGASIKFMKIIDGRFYITVGYGNLYYSDNNGETWTNSNLQMITCVEKFGDSIYVTQNNLNGTLVFQTNKFPEEGSVNEKVPELTHNIQKNENYIFCSNSKGFYRSKNGINWDLVMPDSLLHINFYDYQLSGNIIIAGSHDRWFISNNNGSSFTNLKIDEDTYIHGVRIFSDKKIAWTYDKIYYQDDNQSIWKNISYDLPERIGIKNAIEFDDELWIITESGTYHIDFDDKEWRAVEGFDKVDNDDFLFINQGRFIWGDKSNRGISYKDNIYDEWIESNNGFNYCTLDAIYSNDNIYCAISGDILHISSDFGQTWTHHTINSLNKSSYYPIDMVKFEEKLYISCNLGLIIFNLKTYDYITDPEFKTAKGVRVDNETIYVSDESRLAYKIKNTDKWRFISDSKNYCFDISNNNILFYDALNGIKASFNKGESFSIINQNLPYFSTYDFTIVYNEVRNLFAGSSPTLIFQECIYEYGYSIFSFTKNTWEHYNFNFTDNVAPDTYSINNLLLIDDYFLLASSHGFFYSKIKSGKWQKLKMDLDDDENFGIEATTFYKEGSKLTVGYKDLSMWKLDFTTKHKTIENSNQIFTFQKIDNQIQITSGIKTKGDYIIYNSSGQIEKKGTFQIDSKPSFSINIFDLHNGMHILKLINDEASQSLKFMN